MRSNQIIIGVLLILFCQKLEGQINEVPKISIKYGIIAKAFPDSIVLRWAPNSANALPAHIEAGVWIEKLTVSGKYPYKMSNWEKVTKQPILPMPLDAFNNDATKKNEYAMLGAQLLYGKLPASPAVNEIQNVKDQASMLTSLFSMAMLGCDYSPTAAQMLGMRHVVKIKIKENEKIFFRIYSAYKQALFQVDTSMVFSTFGEWESLNTPQFLTAKSKEKEVELRWPFNKELYRWSGFYIERSADGKKFSRLNKKPFIIMSPDHTIDVFYRDSVQNYIKYYYRVQAIDPFGDLTGYSETVSCYGSDKTPPGQLVLNETHKQNDGITLSWKFAKEKADSDLDHFIVKSGTAVDHIPDTIQILPKNTFSYYFNQKAKIKSTYFEIVAVDTAGNVTSSNPVRYFMADTEPPKTPEGFTAKIDTSGVVHLSWKLDSLDELIGYRVFRKNNINHDFVCLQQGFLSATEFSDTLALNTLTNEIFYAVSAIDMSYNMSQLTSPVRLLKPDKIPPIPPQITNYKLNSKSATIQWGQSPSEDVASYELYRKDDTGTTILLSKNIDLNQTEYTDSTLADRKRYTYYLKSIDKNGLSSAYSFPLEIVSYVDKSIKNISLSWLSEREKIGFKWNDPNPKPAYYIIYKDLGEGIQQHKSVDAEQVQFYENMNKGNHIRYGLQAIYPNQKKSEIFTLEWFK